MTSEVLSYNVQLSDFERNLSTDIIGSRSDIGCKNAFLQHPFVLGIVEIHELLRVYLECDRLGLTWFKSDLAKSLEFLDRTIKA